MEKVQRTEMLHGRTGNAVQNNASEENNDSSMLQRMRAAEEEENTYIPTQEQLHMWDNDARYEDNNSSNYTDEEYEQILRESGYSDEQIAELMGNPLQNSGPTDRMSAREYIESKEDGEAITRRQDREYRRKIKTALGDTAGLYKDGLKRKIRTGLENAKPGRAIGRTMGGALGAATFGTFGVAAGVASGDLKSVAQYGAAGVAGGYKLGTGSASAATNALNVEGLDDTFNRALQGEEQYKKNMARNNQLKKAQDEAVIRRIQEKEKVSRKEAKIRAERYATTYMEEGIDDVDDWIALEKMQQKNVVRKDGKTENRKYSRDEAIAAYNINKRSDIKSKDKNKAMDKIATDFNLGNNKDAIETYYRTAKVFDDIKNG